MKLPALLVDGFDDCQLNFETLQTLFAALPLTSKSWITPTLLNSWANAGSGFETAGYLKDPLGFVHLKGVLAGGATSTSVFQLPAGYRPGGTTFHSLVVSGAPAAAAAAEIAISGVVNVFYVGSTGVSLGLSGVTFLAEN